MNEFEIQECKIKISEYKPLIDKLNNSLNISSLQKQVEKFENQAAEPNFWEDMGNAQKIMQKSNHLKSKISKFKHLSNMAEDCETMIEMLIEENDDSLADELEKTLKEVEREIKEQTLQTLLSGEYDSKNAIITLHAGAGGTEAMDWVEMLFRMYSRWAERHNFKTKTLDYIAGDEAGIKSISILIEGQNAYGYLKSESGACSSFSI